MGEKTCLERIFDHQRDFDRRLGWNIYERLAGDQDAVDYMQLTVLRLAEEVGEIAQETRKILRDKEPFNPQAFKDELIDISVYLIQASMALKMDLAGILQEDGEEQAEIPEVVALLVHAGTLITWARAFPLRWIKQA